MWNEEQKGQQGVGDSKGLPIGLQMIADCFQEKKLFGAASAYEKARGAWKLPVMTDKEGR